jgi:hypothetical protein
LDHQFQKKKIQIAVELFSNINRLKNIHNQIVGMDFPFHIKLYISKSCAVSQILHRSLLKVDVASVRKVPSYISNNQATEKVTNGERAKEGEEERERERERER